MPRTNVRVTGLIFQDSNILLIKRFHNNEHYWTIPGGGVESDESEEEALHREILEETSLTITNFHHVFTLQIPNFHEICHFYLCEVNGEPALGEGPEKLSMSPDNIYDLRWVSMDHFAKIEPNSLYPSAQDQVIKVYKDQH